MKDYSLNTLEQETFILNYEVKDNQITVNLASGKNYVVPYTLYTEIELLEKMKKQVLNAREFEQEQKEKLSSAKRWAIYDGYFLALNSAGLIIDNHSGLRIVLISWFTFSLSTRIWTIIDNGIKIKDINKNRMFLENEKLLNEKVKSKEEILPDVCNKVEKPVFNINTIDKLKYKELKRIIEKVKNGEHFEFDYSSLNKEKSAVLIKKKEKTAR